jgi:hypothetical protein
MEKIDFYNYDFFFWQDGAKVFRQTGNFYVESYDHRIDCVINKLAIYDKAVITWNGLEITINQNELLPTTKPL